MKLIKAYVGRRQGNLVEIQDNIIEIKEEE